MRALTLPLLALLACSNDSPTPEELKADANTPILVLNLLEGERILDVVHGTHDAAPAAALFHLATSAGERLVVAGQRSKVVDHLEDVGFIGGTSSAYAVSRSAALSGFVAWNGTAFAESELYDSVDANVVLEGTTGGFAFSARRAGQGFIVRYDGAAFVALAKGESVWGLDLSPDGTRATYGFLVGKKELRWGVGADHYIEKPNWYALGDGHHALTGKTATGTEVRVDHGVVASHDVLGAVVHDEAGHRLVWAGGSAGVWSVNVASRDNGAAPLASVGGLSAAPTRMGIHAASGQVQSIAASSEGVRYVQGAAGNTLALSPGFTTVTLADSAFKGSPIAFGVRDGTTTVLSGGRASPAWTKVERLVATSNGANYLYVATDAAGARGVDSNGEHATFTAVGGYLFLDNGAPVYVGSAPGREALVIDGKSAPDVVKVQQVLRRAGGTVAWSATTATGMVVGIDATLGTAFVEVSALSLTKSGQLWYDGTTAAGVQRVLEQSVGPTFARLGPVVETGASGKVAYAGRAAVDASGTVNDDVLVDGQPVASLKWSSADVKDAGKAALPWLGLVPDSDNVTFGGRMGVGVGVGLGKDVYGPFEELRDVQLLPDASKIAFLARKGTWAAQVGAERHVELTDAKNLRFTLNGQEIRYDGMRDKTGVTFVGKDEFAAVKLEQMGGGGTVYAFAGQKPDGWHVSVSESGAAARTTSDPWTDVLALRGTSDGFGFDAVVKSADGTRVLRKPVRAAFQPLAAWAAASLPRYHRTPLATHSLSELPEDGGVPVSSAPTVTAETVFVGVGRSVDALEATYLVSAIEGGVARLAGSIDREALARRSDMKVFVLPLDTPFVYGATQGTVKGEVTGEAFYARVDVLPFTVHRRFLAVGRGLGQDTLILGERLVQTAGRIEATALHPDTESDARDSTAVRVRRAEDGTPAAMGWIVADADGREEPLGWVDEVSPRYNWTEHSAAGTHTLVWGGTNETRRFEAVGKERFDSVRDVTVTPRTGTLGYIGRRANQEAVVINGIVGEWYSRVQDLSFQGDTDSPVYTGWHVYGGADEKDTLLPSTRLLASIIHGAERTGWFDWVGHVAPGATLAETTYVASVAGSQALYAGQTPSAGQWKDITGFVRTFDEQGKVHAHFLGRDATGWTEVHDGVKGAHVDALRTTPLTSGVLPPTLAPASASANVWMLVDEQGRYDYIGVLGDQEVFVRQGKVGGGVRAIEQVAYFADGEVVAVVAKDGDTKRLSVNGAVSEPFADIGPLVFSKATGDVHAVVSLPPQKELKGLNPKAIETVDGLRAAGRDYDFTPSFERYALLRGSEIVARGWDIEALVETPRGTYARVISPDHVRVYVNGSLSAPLVSVMEEQSVLLETLAASRYVATRDSRTWVAGADVVAPAFDTVELLQRTLLGGKDVTLWSARSGLVSQVVVDDHEVLRGNAISEIGAYGPLLRANVVQGNLPGFAIGSERVDRAAPVPGGTIQVGGETFTPIALAKDEQQWLRSGESASKPAWAMWDVRATVDLLPTDATVGTPTTQITWSWLEGTLDRVAATMTVKAASLKLPVGPETKAWAWTDLPPATSVILEEEPTVATSGGVATAGFTTKGGLDLATRRALVKAVQDTLANDRATLHVRSAGDAPTYAEGRVTVSHTQDVVDYLRSRGLPAARIVSTVAPGARVDFEVKVAVPPPKRRRYCEDDWGGLYACGWY